jgi:hypothetical protein
VTEVTVINIWDDAVLVNLLSDGVATEDKLIVQVPLEFVTVIIKGVEPVTEIFPDVTSNIELVDVLVTLNDINTGLLGELPI